jgi:hypothetical protein
MRIMKFIEICLITFIGIWSNAYTQCACMGGAPVGGLTPVGGTTNVGILREGNLRAISFYSYSNGDEYYSGDSRAENGSVKSFNSSYMGILVGYGIFENFTVDAEFGFYLNKAQDFGSYTLSGSGLSHTTIYAKFNVFGSRANELEWTVGLGGKIPLNFNEQNLPQHIQSSTGAFGGVMLSYLHKGFKSSGLHFIMLNRFDFNAENSSSYQYGKSFINSLFITKTLIDNFVGIFEIRSDRKFRDKKYGELIIDSGWNNVILSPQLNYGLNNFNFSVFFDLPIYKYYNGKQLTNNYNIGASLTWQTDLLK